jgi:hypothetical protein
LTILEGRWCVPNCYDGGTWDIENQTCTYPANFAMDSSGVLSVGECGQSTISSLPLSNFDYPVDSSCEEGIDITSLF